MEATLQRIETIVAATSNPGKLREIRAILEPAGIVIESIERCPGAPAVEETGATFEENARLKAVLPARRIGAIVLGEDSGLEVDALDGAPGVFSARFAGEAKDPAANIALLLERMKDVALADRTARFRAAACLAGPEGILAEAQGATEGIIAREPSGAGGFGYDPVFLSADLGRTFADATPEEKHAVSHRGRALASLLSLLREGGLVG